MSANNMPAASMPPWEAARPTFSSWGAVFQEDEGWTLAVVDPRIPVDESRERVAALNEWVNWRGDRRWWIWLAGGITLACALLIWVAAAVPETSMKIPVMIGVVLPLVGIPAITAWRKALSAPKRPCEVMLRGAVDARLWRLVRHLNSYRNVEPDHVDAVRGLLWALAHTTPRAELVNDLSERFAGWSEHDAPAIRSAAAQIWANIPTTP
ncbi:hypothetical protein MOQ72_34175 [Saccharopolyspora sp. K220]|uniref:hypothetical protein n=1 Tax=Saccharopolyspora soli TaxID=2926618 RepID=UPI001F569B90|nr:hypothetical protein [Saccharopolyspora soli]MCI2422487.1 hypothetical protein [Saccharopolyspora soli]